MQNALFQLEPVAPANLGGVVIGERPLASVLSVGKGRLADYDYAINPYVGCGFACAYCYARFFVADPDRRDRWGQWVDVKARAVTEIVSRDLKDKRVYMSSATDPYQPVEARARITRGILETLVEPFRQPRLVIQTRSPRVVRDVDLLKQFRHLRVNVSLTTDDDAVRREFEPHCPSVERRLETLEVLRDHGIKIGVSLAPLLPLRDPEAFAKALRRLRPDRVGFAAFHRAQPAFASDTPADALALADRKGWTADAQRAAIADLRQRLPEFADGPPGFGPE